MNNTKKYLIIAAIVFSFIDAGWQIYSVVRYFLTDPIIRNPVFYVVLDFITIVQSLSVAVLLILAIWKNGKLFRQRYGLYMTALMLSIIINLFSISSILLIVSMFISDWVWVKPTDQKEVIIDITPERKEDKIAKLRKMRDNGQITEDEFQEKLIELL